MLAAYYSKGADSEKMFSDLEISKDANFKKHLNKYDVIHIDIQWFQANCVEPDNVVDFVTNSVLDELRKIYPEELPTEVTRLPDALSRIKDKTGQKFVIIIDEWDVLIRDAAMNNKVQEDYIRFCVECLKEQNPQSIFSLHILPAFFQSKKRKLSRH